ncbi:hypothetical protein [Flavobacterium subsaxonicum]|uniref:Uncharacterized protein n=1 Tax=Flavobacterium subsaxonicum WB 4.1-42 = DSM 21790 TaxID=1121898 RepID=A0A0A2MU90_9FLAO|nr:hypothetical protein [Flavobacterium subsaxonicum]KGO91790.1 hypothetical protein Q766_16270 [Flavobacterium subsaxonicum WB 4.1-42 = DSM 21790]
MEAIENIKDVFSIFHDGGIEGWEGDDKLLTLTIGCTYLAERINPQFNVFYVELTGVEKLELHPWTLPVIDNTPALTRPEDIFKGDIEITSCEVVNEVSCYIFISARR